MRPAEAAPVAWVTGAAGGIGRAAVDALAAAGHRVLATDHGTRSGTDGPVSYLDCDVTVPGDLDRAVAAADALGGVDVLVASAARMLRKDVLAVTPADWDAVFDVNAKGVFFTAQAAAASMRRHGRGGTILLFGSLGAGLPRPDITAYGASKGAVAALVGGLAVALAPDIRVNGVLPGTIRTPLNADRWSVPGAVESAAAKVPLGRLGTPADIAPILTFLASDAAAFATGSMFAVDGGRLVNG